ncbi:GNAT family N-acetyltransferase [Marinoscillum sp. MHG1-6]|uniref:GNAT family N-acetyltransferase n=1 Tax=Marinoscillum sp. MHG1-6 TaxID=2959627 RepID=UPI002157AC41|nr:GNAT family N-acetyltransferase [Marinoscillum sp. MHG1-6]
MNLTYKKYLPAQTVGFNEKESVISFLFQHLDEYGDAKADISRCVDYALNYGNHPGGLILSAWDGNKIVGAVVINRTGMGGYIPENILVYVATHADYRGKGIGKKLMQLAIESTEGDIALHVEPDNPAKILYEKIGFTNKYLEMRWKRTS